MPGGKKQGEEEDGGAASDPAVLAMMKAMFDEQRKADQVREKNRRKEETELRELKKGEEAEQKELQKKEELERRELQRQMEERQYAQQIALIKMQEEAQERARIANQSFQEAGKRRDRFLFTMSSYQEGGDLEEYFSTAERKMESAKLPKEDWPAMMEARLTGRVAVSWRDLLLEEGGDFVAAKNKLLKAYGYTSKVASESFFNFRLEDCNGMTADSLYGRGQQLLRRIVAPAKIPPDVEFPLVRGWAYSLLPRRAKLILDSRNLNNAADVIGAMQDFLSIDSGKGEGQTASFKKQSYEHRENRENRENRERTARICFNCGKIGHKAADCWGPKKTDDVQKMVAPSNNSGTGGAANSDGGIAKIICFTCHKEGHKSPQCPDKIENSKGAKIRSINRIWSEKEISPDLNGLVNNYEAPIILDTGSSISTVMETMVSPNQLTGEHVFIDGIFCEELTELPLAEVWFEVGNLKWKEEVAVVPVREDGLNEVIYALKLCSERGKKLLAMLEEDDEDEIEEEGKIVVKTAESEMASENAQDGPTIVDLKMSRQNSEAPVIQEVGVAVPVRQDVEMDGLGILEEEEEMEILCIKLDASVDEKEDEKEEDFILKEHQGGGLGLEMHFGKEEGSEKEIEKEIEQVIVKRREDEFISEVDDFVVKGDDVVFEKEDFDDLVAEADVTEKEKDVFILEKDEDDIMKKNRGEQAKRCDFTEDELVVEKEDFGDLGFDSEVKPGVAEKGEKGFNLNYDGKDSMVENRKEFYNEITEDEELPEKEIDRGGARKGRGFEIGYLLKAGFYSLVAILLSNFVIFSPNVVVWVDAMVEAFDQIKVSLVNICVLTIPCQGDMFSLHTDASSLGVGATLNVLREEDELPVAYFSRQLQGAQQFYSATELEMLAIYMSVIHFDHFLMGTEFKIITDHKALVYLLSAKKLNKRLYGWMLKLLDFSFEIIYRPGSMHQDADSLSRQNWNTSSFGRHEDWNISPTQPRAAGVLEKGGDVGTTPLERTEDQDQDCQT